MQIRISV